MRDEDSQIGEQFEAFIKRQAPELKGNLNDALFSADEYGLWEDFVDSVSPEQAMMCWRIVEKLRTEEFPQELIP